MSIELKKSIMVQYLKALDKLDSINKELYLLDEQLKECYKDEPVDSEPIAINRFEPLEIEPKCSKCFRKDSCCYCVS